MQRGGIDQRRKQRLDGHKGLLGADDGQGQAADAHQGPGLFSLNADLPYVGTLAQMQRPRSADHETAAHCLDVIGVDLEADDA